MATYKGREVSILGNVARDEDVVIRIRTVDGEEIVKRSEVTIYDPKDVPETMEPPKDRLFGFKKASKQEIDEKKAQEKLVADKQLESDKAAAKAEAESQAVFQVKNQTKEPVKTK